MAEAELGLVNVFTGTQIVVSSVSCATGASGASGASGLKLKKDKALESGRDMFSFSFFCLHALQN